MEEGNNNCNTENEKSSQGDQEQTQKQIFVDIDLDEFKLKTPYYLPTQTILTKQAKRLFKIGQGGVSLPGLSYFSQKPGAMNKNIASNKIMDSLQSIKVLSEDGQNNIKKQLLPIIFSPNSNHCEHTIDFFKMPKESYFFQKRQSVMTNDIGLNKSKKKSKGGTSFSSRHQGKDRDKQKDSKETFIQPDFMQDRGSMCITELWPESMKLELVKSNQPNDKKSRELFRPKYIHNQEQSYDDSKKNTSRISRKNSQLSYSVIGGANNISMNNSVFENDIKSTLPQIISTQFVDSPEKKKKSILQNIFPNNNSSYISSVRPDARNSLLTNHKMSESRRIVVSKLSQIKNQCEELLENSGEIEQSINFGINTVDAKLNKFLQKLT